MVADSLVRKPKQLNSTHQTMTQLNQTLNLGVANNKLFGYFSHLRHQHGLVMGPRQEGELTFETEDAEVAVLDHEVMCENRPAPDLSDLIRAQQSERLPVSSQIAVRKREAGLLESKEIATGYGRTDAELREPHLLTNRLRKHGLCVDEQIGRVKLYRRSDVEDILEQLISREKRRKSSRTKTYSPTAEEREAMRRRETEDMAREAGAVTMWQIESRFGQATSNQIKSLLSKARVKGGVAGSNGRHVLYYHTVIEACAAARNVQLKVTGPWPDHTEHGSQRVEDEVKAPQPVSPKPTPLTTAWNFLDGRMLGGEKITRQNASDIEQELTRNHELLPVGNSTPARYQYRDLERAWNELMRSC